MNDSSNITNLPTAKEPPEPKTRTITLTGRAPIKIVEDDWPIIAQGVSSYDGEAPWYWGVEFRVRQNKHGYSLVIHGKYTYYDETNEDGQLVRVGRLLSGSDTSDLWKHMQEVGEEMRSRILIEKHQKHVTFALDQTFANLPPRPTSV